MEWFDPQWTWTQISVVLISAIVGGGVALIVRALKKSTMTLTNFVSMQETQSEALRNIIKTLIVVIHDEATNRGYIGKYKLDACERLYTSYAKLNGNSYVEDLMNEMRGLGTQKKS